MRSKITAVTKRLISFYENIKRNVSNRTDRRRLSSVPDHCDAHMNELPVPCGDWKTWYGDKQSYYNKILAVGALTNLLSFILAIYTGSIYLNWGPPLQPGPPSDMVIECEDED